MAGRKRDAAQQADCLSSIILQPRMNQRDRALDTYRRQQLAKTLVHGTASAAPSEPDEPIGWGSFLSIVSTDTILTDAGAASREHESLGEALNLVSSASDASCCTVPSHAPAQRDIDCRLFLFRFFRTSLKCRRASTLATVLVGNDLRRGRALLQRLVPLLL